MNCNESNQTTKLLSLIKKKIKNKTKPVPFSTLEEDCYNIENGCRETLCVYQEYQSAINNNIYILVDTN